MLEVFKPTILPLESLSSQIGKLVLFHFKLLRSHFLISDGEVLIKAFALYILVNFHNTYLRRSGC